MTATPPKHHNFDVIPTITSRDEFWHRKYAESDEGIPVPVPVGASVDAEHDGDVGHIHMPDPSLWPFIGTLGVLPLGYGLVYANWLLIGVGAVWLVAGMFGWIIEPLAEGDDDEPALAGAATH